MNPCLICQGSLKPFRTTAGYELIECTGCGIIRLTNALADQTQFIEKTHNSKDPAEAEGTDAGYDYFSFPEYVEKYQTTFDYFFRQRCNRLKSHGVKTGAAILDAGCGYGFFVKFLSGQGYAAAGIDIEPNCTDFAKTTLNLEDIHYGTLEQFDTAGNKFDAIVSCDVLEHCPDPTAFMASCRALLKSDGLLYLQVPNVIGFRIPYGYSLGLPYHIWHYNPKSLKTLLETNGFEVLEYWTGTSGVINQKEKSPRNFFFRLKIAIASFFKIGIRLQMVARYRK